MYEYISGRLAEKNPAYVVMDCNGIAYRLNISLNTYSGIKDSEKGKLFTHLVVREDAHILFGFADNNERKLFRHLISVSGVGANTARMILSSLTPSEVHKSIINNDSGRLQKIKGIGTKSAQRIILDLKDKLEKEPIAEDLLNHVHNTIKDDALSALLMLGFSKNASLKVLDQIIKSEDDSISVEELIKLALKKL